MKFCMPILFIVLFLLTGCGVQVVPRTSSQIAIAPDKETLTTTKDGLTVTAKVQDLEFGPYTGVNNVTAFYVTIANMSHEKRTVPLTSFMLFDQDRRLYRALEAKKVTALNQQELNFLIPYPYVGFYYLQDSADFDFSTQSASSLSYSPENTTPSAEAYALPVGEIPPGANIAGMLYFNIDLYEKKFVNLTIDLQADKSFPETGFSFLFDVVK